MKKAAKRRSKAGPLTGALSVKGRVTRECVRAPECVRTLTEVGGACMDAHPLLSDCQLVTLEMK